MELALRESLALVGRLLGPWQVQTPARNSHFAQDAVRQSAFRMAAASRRTFSRVASHRRSADFPTHHTFSGTIVIPSYGQRMLSPSICLKPLSILRRCAVSFVVLDHRSLCRRCTPATHARSSPSAPDMAQIQVLGVHVERAALLRTEARPASTSNTA